FEDNSFDLITVAQAVHWFEIDKFNEEVKRVGKPNSLIALIGYELCSISPEIDKIIRYFYEDIIGKYWDPERKHLQSQYQYIPFPFKELETPSINNIKLWRYDHLVRSEEHTSELQSREKLVCRLLLENKKGSDSGLLPPG